MRIWKLGNLFPTQKKNSPSIPKMAKASDVKLIKAREYMKSMSFLSKNRSYPIFHERFTLLANAK